MTVKSFPIRYGIDILLLLTKLDTRVNAPFLNWCIIGRKIVRIQNIFCEKISASLSTAFFASYADNVMYISA